MRTHRLLSHPCSSEYTTANTSRLSHLDLIEDIPIDLSLSDAVELFLGLQMPPLPLSCLHHALPMPSGLKSIWQPIYCHLRTFWMHCAYLIALI